jgi:nitroimidazol reductase NimA-like FMN-containing flavoprotein (pyridoxamine 5'-phosphate oxidase superfamily)
MSSKSTATAENALTFEEIDMRLRSTTLARLASFRADGMIHLTPIWFDWTGSVLRLSLGAGRVHLKNLAADRRVTILVDEDSRLSMASRRAHGRSSAAASPSSRLTRH